MPDPKERVEKQRTQFQKYRAKAHAYRKQLAWAIKKKTVHRKKLKAAQEDLKKSHKAKFQPYMLNGHSGNVTDHVKAEIVLGVVKFGLAVTSTADGVPGDGRHTSTSLHYPQNNADGKGHAVDIAGARMEAFQIDRYHSGRSHFQELYGPNNGDCVKNGQTSPLAEGTPLETLHDTHCHDAPY